MDCWECDANNLSDSEMEEICSDCEYLEYRKLDNNFINYLIVYLSNRLSKIDDEKIDNSEEEITSEEFEILRFLYEIYKDN